MSAFESMKKLHQLGWDPIPMNVYLSKNETKRFKTPLVKWQSERGTISQEKITSWEESLSYPAAIGLAIITGKQRDGTSVVVVDLDPPEQDATSPLTIPDELLEACASTMSTITPSGGRHYYFKYEGDYTLTNKTNLFRKNKATETVIDLRAEGGISVIGDSKLWRWEWREKTQRNPSRAGEKKQTTFTKTHPIEQVKNKEYITLDYIAPSDLEPLPNIIIDQYVKISNPDNPQDVKKMWKLVQDKEMPDKEKGETAHEVLLSWSMKLLSTYLPTISTDEEARGLYKRFIKDISFIVENRRKEGGRQMDEEYLKRIFTSAIKKLKQKRSASYRMASGFLDPILKENLVEAQRSRWSDLKVTKILNFSSLLFATNDEETEGFELSPLSILRQQEWRSKHLITFGAPTLPTLPKTVFEQLVSEIPIRSMEHTNSSAQNVIHIITNNWLDLAASNEDEVTDHDARIQAKNTGRGGFSKDNKITLYLKLSAIQNELKSEGYGLIAPTKLAQILTNLSVSPVPATSFWEITREL